MLLRWWNGFEEVYDPRADPAQVSGGVSSAELPSLDALRAGLGTLVGCSGRACSSVKVERVRP